MNMSSSGFAPRRRQGGFIQGAILFALVIIAVVVAAFSLANRDSSNSADNEQARVNAAFVLKVGSDIQTGINRAVADGFPTVDIQEKLVLGADSTTLAGEMSLFDQTLRYVARPQFPPTALDDADGQPFEVGAAEGVAVRFTGEAITGVGGSDADVLLEIPNLRNDVCRRINVTANNLLPTADPLGSAGEGGAREGCYATTADGVGTYYRVVATDVGTAAGG
jgi:hypothetical protein